MFQYYGLTRDTFSRSMHTSTSMMQNHSFAVCICILNLLAVELTCHTVVYTLRWKSKCSNNWTAWDSTLVTVSVASTHSRTRDYSNTSLYGAYVCISDLISEVRVENIRMHRLILFGSLCAYQCVHLSDWREYNGWYKNRTIHTMWYTLYFSGWRNDPYLSSWTRSKIHVCMRVWDERW